MPQWLRSVPSDRGAFFVPLGSFILACINMERKTVFHWPSNDIMLTFWKWVAIVLSFFFGDLSHCQSIGFSQSRPLPHVCRLGVEHTIGSMDDRYLSVVCGRFSFAPFRCEEWLRDRVFGARILGRYSGFHGCIHSFSWGTGLSSA